MAVFECCLEINHVSIYGCSLSLNKAGLRMMAHLKILLRSITESARQLRYVGRDGLKGIIQPRKILAHGRYKGCHVGRCKIKQEDA